MSWVSQFLGIDAAAAQENAIATQQQQAAGQQKYWQNYMKQQGSAWDTAMAQYQQAIGDQGAVRAEYQGALKDIYDTGRTQASQSGLIGGFQEMGNTAPQIAALGRNFASQMAQLQLSPFQMQMQRAQGLEQGGMQAAVGAGQNYTQTLGNYAQGANPLGNIFGAIGGIAGAAGSFMGGLGSLMGVGSGGGIPGVNGMTSSGALGTGQWQPPQMNFGPYSSPKY